MYVYTETDKPLLSVELRFLIINIAILKEYVLYMYVYTETDKPLLSIIYVLYMYYICMTILH